MSGQSWLPKTQAMLAQEAKSSSTDKVKEMERHLVMLLAPPLASIQRSSKTDLDMIAEQITLLIRAVVADELSKRGE